MSDAPNRIELDVEHLLPRVHINHDDPHPVSALRILDPYLQRPNGRRQYLRSDRRSQTQTEPRLHPRFSGDFTLTLRHEGKQYPSKWSLGIVPCTVLEFNH